MRFQLFPRSGLLATPLIFAGVALLCCLTTTAFSKELSPTVEDATASFAQQTPGRMPTRAFATDAGVYELDPAAKCIRVWSKAHRLLGGELTESRLVGLDSAGNGVPFEAPVDMFKIPGMNRFAVLDSPAGRPLALVDHFGSVQFYDFKEEGEGNSLTVTFTKVGGFTDEKVVKENEVSSIAGDAAATIFTEATEKIIDVENMVGPGKVFETLEEAAKTIFGRNSLSLSLTFGSSLTWMGNDEWAIGLDTYGSTASGGADSYIIVFSGVANATVKSAFRVASGVTTFTANYDGEEYVDGARYARIKALAADPDTKSLFAADPNNNCVYRYDLVGGTYETEVPVYMDLNERFSPDTPPTVIPPTQIGVMAAALPDAVYGEEFIGNNDKSHFSNPSSVQIWKTPAGDKVLLVADFGNMRLSGLDLDTGLGLFTYGKSGSKAGEFVNPAGVWGSEDGLRFAVADTGNGRVQTLSVTAADFAPDLTFKLSGFPMSKVAEATNLVIGGVSIESTNLVDRVIVAESDTNAWPIVISVDPGLVDRTFQVSVAMQGGGSAKVEPASVTIPAGEATGTFSFWATDGLADGSVGTITVAESSTLTQEFTVTNVPPSLFVRASAQGFAETGFIPTAVGAYGENVNEVEPGVAAQFFADAFDVAADAPLTYNWYVYEINDVQGNLSAAQVQALENNFPDSPWFLEAFDVANFFGIYTVRRWKLKEKTENAGATYSVTVPDTNTVYRVAVEVFDKDGASEFGLTTEKQFFFNVTGAYPEEPPPPPPPGDLPVISQPKIVSFELSPDGSKVSLSYTFHVTNGIEMDGSEYVWTLESSPDLSFASPSCTSLPGTAASADGADATGSVADVSVSGDARFYRVRAVSVPPAE